MRTINNTEDVIDSRDVIERIEELEAIVDEANTKDDINDEQDELRHLRALQDEAESSPDWRYGEALIRESYFTEYCEDLCKDIGALPQELPSYIEGHIDWDGVASDIKMDYGEVDFDGVSYFIRQ